MEMMVSLCVCVCVCAGLSEAKEEVEGPLPTPHHLGHNH